MYDVALSLERVGDAVVAPSGTGRWSTYSASDTGVKKGQLVLARLDERTRDYFRTVSEWVRVQAFSSLVKSIYDAYPDMKVNTAPRYSVWVGYSCRLSTTSRGKATACSRKPVIGLANAA